RLAEHREPELVVEHLLKLLRPADVARSAGRGVRLRLRLGHRLGALAALPAPPLGVAPVAGTLHLEQHFRERLFELDVELRELRHGLEPRPELAVQAQRDVSVLGRVAARALEIELVERDLLRAAAANVLELDRALAEI